MTLTKLMERVVVDSAGCWLFTGFKDAKGYGKVWHQGKKARAHRVAYELAVGKIPSSLELDHLCRVRSCINPAHLEAVTRRENLMRGLSFCSRHARKTHCPKGHAYEGENLILRIRGRFTSRECRECKRAFSRERGKRFRSKHQ
jgi:hypothetical protein